VAATGQVDGAAWVAGALRASGLQGAAFAAAQKRIALVATARRHRGAKAVSDANTKWDQLSSRFKNSWIGVVILALIAVAAVFAQFSGLITKIWEGPPPAADLRRIEPEITPLEKFSDKVTTVGSDTIYPVGATFKFALVHNGAGEEAINIGGLDVRVDGFDADAACPFSLTGDRIFGAGEAPLRVFTVHMADGKVSSVQYKPAPDERMKRGKSNNLLDTEDAPPLRLRKTGDETEAIKVTFIADDAGRYRLGLSVRYANRDGRKTATIPSATICKPRE